MVDLDNDGWKDIFVSNGIWRRPNDLDYLKYISNKQIQQQASDLQMATQMPSGVVNNYCFKNQGNLQFENISSQWGLDLIGSSNGAIFVDLNNDGQLDLVLNNLNQEAAIFKNRGNAAYHYLKIQLKETGLNTQGIGARVRLGLGNQVLIQEHFVSRGFQSAIEPMLHFGLGSTTLIDFLEVKWSDGLVEKYRNVEADQLLILEKGAGSEIVEDVTEPMTLLFSNITERMGINFHHRENDFNDFDREKTATSYVINRRPLPGSCGCQSRWTRRCLYRRGNRAIGRTLFSTIYGRFYTRWPECLYDGPSAGRC